MAGHAARRVGVLSDHLAQGGSIVPLSSLRLTAETAASTTTAERSHFLHWHRISTRWADNDMYGHTNNAVFYEWMDTTINRFLIRSAGFVPTRDNVIAYCVQNGYTFKHSVAFPQAIECGLRLKKLGRASVCYEAGIFPEGSEEIAALGHFVQVFVDRQTERPTPIPPHIRAALRTLQLPPATSSPAASTEPAASITTTSTSGDVQNTESPSSQVLDAVLSLGIGFSN